MVEAIANSYHQVNGRIHCHGYTHLPAGAVQLGDSKDCIKYIVAARNRSRNHRGRTARWIREFLNRIRIISRLCRQVICNTVISVARVAYNIVGNASKPNKFSNNLLNNLGYLTGTKPYIRVGGNTQDYAIYNPNLTIALKGTVNVTRSPDYPTTIEIGPSFFESYSTWPNVKFTHGFNMGGNHDDRQWATLIQTAEIACKTLGKDKLNWWEYGNEPDLFSTSAQGPVRSSNYNESDYVTEWLAATRAIKGVLSEACPDMLGNDTYGYLAPSFAGLSNHLTAPRAWTDGLDTDGTVRLFSTHK